MDWDSLRGEFMQVQFVAGIVDVDADESPIGVEIQNDAFRDFVAVCARVRGEGYVERISVRVVIELHWSDIFGREMRCGW